MRIFPPPLASMLHIVQPWEVAGVITDAGIGPALVAAYRDRGVHLTLARK